MKIFLAIIGTIFSFITLILVYILDILSRIINYRPKYSGGLIFVIILFYVVYVNTLNNYQDNVNEVIDQSSIFGLDISQYQGDIDWSRVFNESHHPTEYIIVRATMGDNRVDSRYWKNIEAIRSYGIRVGSYHYYDPNENSKLQAENFIRNVSIRSGDFVPIVDIERLPRKNGQSISDLRNGLRNFLKIIENHYDEKPIIYTGLSFYKDYLMTYNFDDYPLWLAAYDIKRRKDPILIEKAHIHQFTERVRVKGISSNLVDGNDIIKNSDILYVK
jgi:GH25 family lysozyme M1 (1,4-beta-N-acetylmuramidase)